MKLSIVTKIKGLKSVINGSRHTKKCNEIYSKRKEHFGMSIK